MRRFLVDSHVYLWLLKDVSRLNNDTLALLGDPSSRVFVSVATIWELSIKSIAGRLDISVDDIVAGVEEMSLLLLEFNLKHVLGQQKVIMSHKDPFDRIISAQAMVEGFTLVTSDASILSSNVQTLKA
jgi:PIN domain nuclease of toxin-antitoxin system